MSKLYTVAGASVQNGEFKYRFANSHDRAAVLARAGHSWVKLFTLPHPMYKEDAARWLDDKHPRLVAESASSAKPMERVAETVTPKRVPRKGTDEDRVNAQFAIWRERAVKKFDFLVD
jgi:hypothetical protein